MRAGSVLSEVGALYLLELILSFSLPILLFSWLFAPPAPWGLKGGLWCGRPCQPVTLRPLLAVHPLEIEETGRREYQCSPTRPARRPVGPRGRVPSGTRARNGGNPPRRRHGGRRPRMRGVGQSLREPPTRRMGPTGRRTMPVGARPEREAEVASTQSDRARLNLGLSG